MMKFFGRVGTVMEFLISGTAADPIDFVGRKIFLNQTVPGHLLHRFIPCCVPVFLSTHNCDSPPFLSGGLRLIYRRDIHIRPPVSNSIHTVDDIIDGFTLRSRGIQFSGNLHHGF